MDTKLDVLLFCEQFFSLGLFNGILLLSGMEGIHPWDRLSPYSHFYRMLQNFSVLKQI